MNKLEILFSCLDGMDENYLFYCYSMNVKCEPNYQVRVEDREGLL